MNKYETTIIIDPMLDQTKIAGIIKRYEEIISAAGEIIETEKWGKKRLAYPINKKPTGFYVHFRYTAEAGVPEKLKKDFNLNTQIVRFLTIATDKKAEQQAEKNKNAQAAKEKTETKEVAAK